MSKRTVHILIPILNEAGNIAGLLDNILTIQQRFGGRYDLRLILVDDGSTDGGAEIAKKIAGERGIALEVLTHPVNRGPGIAFATGFMRLASLLGDEDWVVTMEGDNTSRCELLEQMLQRTAEGYEVIFASPYMYGGGILQTSPLRLFLSHMSNTFVRECLGIHGILTVSSFFRLYSARIIRDLQSVWGPGIVERAGFESMIELTMKLIHRGAQLSEVPMVLDTSRRVGRSKMKILRTIGGYLTMMRDRPRWCQQETRCRPSSFAVEQVVSQ